MTRPSLAIVLCSATVFACGGGFESAARVQKLRLLAIAADHPDARPGDDVQLDVLYADPKNREIQWGFALCEQPPSSAALDCALSLDPDTLVVRDDARYDFTMPEPSADSARESAVGVAVVACPGEITPGSTLGIPVQCVVDGHPLDISRFEIGIKRVFYREGGENHNPKFSELYFDGEVWADDDVKEVDACDRDTDDVDKCPKSTQHLLAAAAPDAVESYVDGQGQRVREQVVVQFYGTGGRFEFEARTADDAHTRWAARSDAGDDLTLYFVVRDNRGGVSFQTRRVHVR